MRRVTDGLFSLLPICVRTIGIGLIGSACSGQLMLEVITGGGGGIDSCVPIGVLVSMVATLICSSEPNGRFAVYGSLSVAGRQMSRGVDSQLLMIGGQIRDWTCGLSRRKVGSN